MLNKEEILKEHESWKERRIQEFKKEITCNNCGCTPKPDEWSSATLCIDCQHNEEENDDIRTDDKRNT